MPHPHCRVLLSQGRYGSWQARSHPPHAPVIHAALETRLHGHRRGPCAAGHALPVHGVTNCPTSRQSVLTVRHTIPSPPWRGVASLRSVGTRRANKQVLARRWTLVARNLPLRPPDGEPDHSRGVCTRNTTNKSHMAQAPRTLHALRAEDVMTRHPVTMDITGTVQDAADLMCAADVRHIPVVEHGTLVGMISDRDLRATYCHGRSGCFVRTRRARGRQCQCGHTVKGDDGTPRHACGRTPGPLAGGGGQCQPWHPTPVT